MTRRTIRLGLLAVGFVAVLAELVSALAIRHVGRLDEPIRRTRSIYAEQTARIRVILDSAPTAAMMIDSVSGWSPRPGHRRIGHAINSRGLRGRREYDSAAAGTLRVAAFGDSFVYGNEVHHPNEWAAVIESAYPGVDMLNYGVSGYGTDQALLRFRRSGMALQPELVLMGFTTDDLGRAVNVYRRFRHVNEYPLFKPRFLLGEDGSLTLQPTPVTGLDGYQPLLRDPRAVRDFAKNDWWYQPWIYENPLYDWSATVRLASTVFVRARRRLVPGYRLFADGEFDTTSTAFRLQVRLFDEFARSVREAGSAPVALFLPDRTSVELARAGKPVLYARLRDAVRRLDIPVVDAADAFVGKTDPVPDWFAPGGHYSVAGNRIVAMWLGPQLPGLARPAAP